MVTRAKGIASTSSLRVKSLHPSLPKQKPKKETPKTKETQKSKQQLGNGSQAR
jgi:hypothetical protein